MRRPWFSPDGKYLLVRVGLEGNGPPPKEFDTLALWEVATNRRVWGISGNKHKAGIFAFLLDGKQIVFLDIRSWFGGRGGDVLCLCEAATGKVTRIFDGDASDVGRLAAAPDSARVLLAFRHAPYLEFLDLKTGKRGLTLEKEPHGVPDAVAVSPDGKLALCVIKHDSGQTSNLLLWDAQTGKLVRAFPRTGSWGAPAAFTPDSKSVLAGGHRSGKLCFVLWDIATQKEVRAFEGTAETIAFTSDGTGLLGGHTSRRTLTRWDVTTGKQEWSVQVSGAMPHTFAYSPDGKWVFTSAGSARDLAGEGVELRLWDADTGKLVRPLTDKDRK